MIEKKTVESLSLSCSYASLFSDTTMEFLVSTYDRRALSVSINDNVSRVLNDNLTSLLISRSNGRCDRTAGLIALRKRRRVIGGVCDVRNIYLVSVICDRSSLNRWKPPTGLRCERVCRMTDKMSENCSLRYLQKSDSCDRRRLVRLKCAQCKYQNWPEDGICKATVFISRLENKVINFNKPLKL